MLLNSKYSNFSFSFPKKWFYPEIYEKYDIFFKRNPIPYTNLDDYMSYTIGGVSWPSFQGDGVEQWKDGRKYIFKSGTDFQNNLSKEFKLTFRTVEGFLNYWVMFDQLQVYWRRWAEDKPYLDDFMVNILDQSGHLIMSMLIKGLVFTGLSELEMSFSSNIPEYRTFEASFSYNQIEFKNQLD